MKAHRTFLRVAFVLPCLGAGVSKGADADFFERSIRPLLIERCYECHSQADPEKELPAAGLRLDTASGWKKGGASGAAIAPGKPDESLLIKAVKYNDPLLQMPPDGKLSDREISALAKWIEEGAIDPRVDPVAPASSGEPSEPPLAEQYPAETLDWWAWKPVARPAVPNFPAKVSAERPPSDAVDRFILAKLAEGHLSQPSAADKLTLLRRATFDLTGLPPTPEEADAFLVDDSPAAFARVVDRLLASRAYGERWGRHWLDVVRYADTSGCNGDFPIPQAYRYRNYVIDSYCEDKPYDRFLTEQLAGDLLPFSSEEERCEQAIATGYLAISRRFSSLGEEFHLTLDDTIDNFGKAMLGLTLSCARCHSHKFDPIPQLDYYGLYGIFQSTVYSFPGTEIYRHQQHTIPLAPAEDLQAEYAPLLAEMTALDEKIFAAYTRVAELDTGKEKDETRGRFEAMQKERDALLKRLPPIATAFGAQEGSPASARVQIKGDPKNLGPAAARRFVSLTAAAGLDSHLMNEAGSGRLDLAAWLTNARHPLTARVMVNRLWQGHFGRGFVRTCDDFGTRGNPPSHPELLDYLASEFIAGGWSIKSIHRRLMLSETYASAAVERLEYARLDPENERLWSFPRRRLEAEELRDALLEISGDLDRSMAGPHPFPPEWEWRYTQHHPFVDDYPTRRRAAYLLQTRIRQQPYLAVFDGADANAATGTRKTSTTPQQALFMLNSEFAHERAGALADRLARETEAALELQNGTTFDRQLDRAYRLVLGRKPTADERSQAVEYLKAIAARLVDAGASQDESPRAAWASYLRVLLSGNEFTFVE